MKKRIQKWGVVVVLILFCLPVFAEEYRAECMTPNKKYKKCTVVLQENTLEWKFKSEKYQKFNGKIEGDQIGLVLSGQIKKQGIPLVDGGIFGVLSVGAKKMEEFLVEYMLGKDKKSELFLRVNKKDGLVFGDSLRKIKEGGQ